MTNVFQPQTNKEEHIIVDMDLYNRINTVRMLSHAVVVLETMHQCMTILEELNQPYMQVAYHLAIAKIAFQIQATEKNKFDKYINPFSPDLPANQLFNIASGKAATPKVDEFLLNVEKISDDQRKNFISECTAGKDQEMKIQQDLLFERMLRISMDHKIDVPKILPYPITPVPLFLCHLNSGIYKTDKSVLAKCLEDFARP
ncbi:hypothetical protein M0804_013777 [Polistes exclamans]|nr:hypothetical protein M0804_013777 [Polistes exclamans]